MLYSNDIHKELFTYIVNNFTECPIYYTSEQQRNSKEKSYIYLQFYSSNYGSLHHVLSRNINFRIAVYSDSETRAKSLSDTFTQVTLSENYELQLSNETTIARISPLTMPLLLGKSQNGLYVYETTYEVVY